MKKYYHALSINLEKCTGCTRCVRVCPTEALRVREEKVQLDNSRCIDCGKCARECPEDAILTYSDRIDKIHEYEHKIAILSTPFAGQFPEEVGYANAKKTLYHIGFNEVIEESMITEKMSVIIRDYVRKQKKKPVLSSSCPAVVRLIQVRFFDLLPNILHIEAPMSVLTMYYRKKYAREHNLKPEDVGIFHIVPCIAQVTAVHEPVGAYKRIIDGAISINDIFSYAIQNEKEILSDPRQVEIYPKGLSWAIAGQEAREINNGEIKTLAVNGIRNIINILAKIENGQLSQYDFVVLRSCTNGCVGGVLNVENPFVASSRIDYYLRNSQHKDFYDDDFYAMYKEGKFDVLPLAPRSIMNVGNDIKNALSIMKKIRENLSVLPGLDCSACGSPTCRALAEDIVNGKASLDDCIVRRKKSIKE